MTSTVISNTAPFGQMTNELTAVLYEAGEAMNRLNAAVATAASGYEGTDGTQYEDGTNFGVAADPGSPGSKGKDYAYAVGALNTAWQTFWTDAQPYLEQLDNGVRLP